MPKETTISHQLPQPYEAAYGGKEACLRVWQEILHQIPFEIALFENPWQNQSRTDEDTKWRPRYDGIAIMVAILFMHWNIY